MQRKKNMNIVPIEQVFGFKIFSQISISLDLIQVVLKDLNANAENIEKNEEEHAKKVALSLVKYCHTLNDAFNDFRNKNKSTLISISEEQRVEIEKLLAKFTLMTDACIKSEKYVTALVFLTNKIYVLKAVNHSVILESKASNTKKAKSVFSPFDTMKDYFKTLFCFAIEGKCDIDDFNVRFNRVLDEYVSFKSTNEVKNQANQKFIIVCLKLKELLTGKRMTKEEFAEFESQFLKSRQSDNDTNFSEIIALIYSIQAGDEKQDISRKIYLIRKSLYFGLPIKAVKENALRMVQNLETTLANERYLELKGIKSKLFLSIAEMNSANKYLIMKPENRKQSYVIANHLLKNNIDYTEKADGSFTINVINLDMAAFTKAITHAEVQYNKPSTYLPVTMFTVESPSVPAKKSLVTQVQEEKKSEKEEKLQRHLQREQEKQQENGKEEVISEPKTNHSAATPKPQQKLNWQNELFKNTEKDEQHVLELEFDGRKCAYHLFLDKKVEEQIKDQELLKRVKSIIADPKRSTGGQGIVVTKLGNKSQSGDQDRFFKIKLGGHGNGSGTRVWGQVTEVLKDAEGNSHFAVRFDHVKMNHG